MNPTTIAQLPGGVSANGVTANSGGKQQYSDDKGTYIQNDYNVGTPQFKSDYTFTPHPTSAPATPSLMVTSGASRTNYADNVNTMNTAVSNINSGLNTYNYIDNKGQMKQVQGKTPEEAISNAPDRDPHSGVQVTQGKTDAGPTDGSGGPAKTDTTGGAGTGTGGSSTSGATVTTPDGKTYAGIDPVLAKQYNEALSTLDSQISDAKDTLAAAKSTLANDPAATAAVNQIAQKYDSLIKQMQAKNSMLIGSYKTNAARNGGLQYANDMTSDFMSEEMGKASGRISDLITQEQTMILKTQQAYKDGDVKALAAATKALDEANKGKIDAINKLLTATNNAVKTQQAEAKAQAAAAKQTISDDIRVSTSLAKTVADQIASAGITDEATIDKFIDGMATKSGITNPDILRSAVVKARQDAEKFDVGIANTKSTIANRNKTKGPKTTNSGTDGSYKYTSDDVATYTDLMNKGGTGPDGTVYAPRGTGKDTYVDPGAYVASYNDWVKNGGTPQGFVKKFPLTNINPDSRDSLPAGLGAKK